MANTFKRYHEDARLAVFYASAIANHRDTGVITPADLMIGITWRQHAPTCEFRHLKHDADLLWRAVGVTHIPITAKPYKPAETPLDSPSKRVLAYAKMEADSAGEYWIDIDHLLLGILREGGQAADALTETGWTAERIKRTSSASRAAFPPKFVPWFARLERTPWWAWTLLGLAVMAGAMIYLRSQEPEHPASTPVIEVHRWQ